MNVKLRIQKKLKAEKMLLVNIKTKFKLNA